MNAWKASAELERSSPELTKHLIKGILIALGISIILFTIGVIGVLKLVEMGLID